jgi:gluconolactonase
LDGKISDFVADSHRAAGEAIGPDGKLYAAADATDQVLAYYASGKSSVFTDTLHGNDLVIAHSGGMYVTNSPAKESDIGKVWFISPAGEKKIVDPSIKFPNGIALSPDQSLLYVGDYRSHWVYSYQIQSDGTLGLKQKFFDLYVPDSADDAADDGMRVDRDGRLYVTTRVGIQICDQAGRVIAIIPTPTGHASNLTFGGKDFDILYATCNDKIYARQLKVRGALPFEEPIKPAPPKL